MAKSLKTINYDNLLNDIKSLYETKRIDIVSSLILNKYQTIEELKTNKDDPLILEFKELLNDLNSLSYFLSETINSELELHLGKSEK